MALQGTSRITKYATNIEFTTSKLRNTFSRMPKTHQKSLLPLFDSLSNYTYTSGHIRHEFLEFTPPPTELYINVVSCGCTRIGFVLLTGAIGAENINVALLGRLTAFWNKLVLLETVLTKV